MSNHLQAAYEALIEKMQDKANALQKECDEQIDKRLRIEGVLLDVIYEHLGAKGLRQAAQAVDARELDSTGKPYGMLESVEIHYDL
jgi:hypothetical protein